ncbi:MAG: ABC transporter ATP-binding protein [Planctomycetota bacterium]
MTTKSAKIRVSGVTKTFSTAKGTTAVLDGVDLEVRDGEFLAIVGPSGCGKSTLLNCMAGFERPTAGRIHVDDEVVARPHPKRVFVFQETGIFPWFSVWDNVGFGLDGMPFEEKHEHVMKYTRLVGLEGFERSFPAELSGGMKQRVEFARALAVEPDVIFLDEPFGALDAFTRIEMRREIVRIWQETRKTCILVTHDVAEALELADRVAIMTRRPATVHSILEVESPRPRDTDDASLRELRDHVFSVLGVERRA